MLSKNNNNITMAISLVFLLLALTPLSHSKVFLSIDCGSNLESYTDENSVNWMGDGTVITDGESYEVETVSASHVMRTLRAFTDGTKNKYCYAMEAEKNTKVLLRASFLYGNYDGKSSPPSFALLADGNLWNTVSFNDDDHDQPSLYEAIYVLKSDFINLCVAQTEPDQFPFISAIEIRSLGPNMYPYVNSSFALLKKLMVAYGASHTIKYPDDEYDREWIPESMDDGYTKLTNEAESINIKVTDNPPEAIFQYAATTSSTSEQLILDTGINRDKAVEIYINMYFTEVTRLNSMEKRSFVFTIDGKVSSEPIVPPFGSVLEKYWNNTRASSGTNFSLVATEDSTLPPLISAMEVFYVIGPLTEGTNSNDWEVLVSLQEKFSVLQDSVGDPCLPSSFTWNWVYCSSDDRPRITALYLSGYGLNGTIPDFSSLDALEIIDMSNNSLTGSIPSYLGNMPKLKELNLADNKLSGSIPSSLSNSSNVEVYASGNPLCSSSKSSACTRQAKSTSSSTSSKSFASVERKSDKLTIILAALVSGFFAFLLLYLLYNTMQPHAL